MKLFPRMSREEATARVKAAFDDPSRSEWDAGLADAAESAQPLLALLRGNGPGEEPQQSAGPREASSPRREPSAQAPGTARGLWAAVSSPASADRPSRPASPRSPGSGQREGSSAWSAPADRAASPSRGGAARTRAEQPVRDEPEASAPPGRFLAETSTFASAGLGRRLQRRLSTLGFRRPSVVQARALPVALAGRHAVIHAETGSGKTLAFALPLLQRLEGLSTDGTGPLGLVLVPSPELCEQVAAVLAVLDPGCKPQALHGSTSREAQLALARGGGESRVLVATPQSLLKVLGMPVKGAIALLSHVRVVAVDEADFLLSSLRGPVERCLWMAGQPSRADRQARSALAAAAIDAGKPIAELPPPIPRGARPRPVGEPGSATGGSANWAGGRLPRLGRDSSAQFLFAAATLSDTTHRAVGEWFRRHFEGAEVVRTAGAHRAVVGAELSTVVVDSAAAVSAARSAALARGADDEEVSASMATAAQEARLAAVAKAIRGDAASSADGGGGITLVFVNSQAQAEATTAWLQERLVPAAGAAAASGWGDAVRVEALHQALPKDLRRDVAAELVAAPEEAAGAGAGVSRRSQQPLVLVATDLAARGLDSRSVRHVVNAWLPCDAATFLHRAGRTARAGESGRVTTVVVDKEAGRAAAMLREAAQGGTDTDAPRSYGGGMAGALSRRR
ncbi:hypothetical protein FNF28_01240 [Cafeteria roenbergensis]|nr:hypothetical protein FNF28_01240 [Cafeteria roenbergensis]